MHAAVTGQCPQYIRDIVHPLSTLSERNRLRAAVSDQFNIPTTRTFRGKSFLSGLSAWVELFDKILQTSQTEKLLNELLRHIILN